MPSTQVKCAPAALSTKTGKSPGHLTIQLIGTPPGMWARARSASSRERGRAAVKAARSRSCSAGQAGSVEGGHGRILP